MEQADTEKYIKDHIRRVRFHLATFIQLLSYRAASHDESKLKEPELSWWKQMDNEPRYPYGSEEYKKKVKRWKKVFDHHYAKNRHHPEHFQLGIDDMNIIDLVEMVCDWLGYKEILSINEAVSIVEKQMKRYGFSDEIRNLITNTLLSYFSIVGGKDSYYPQIPAGLKEEIGDGKSKSIDELNKSGLIIDFFA